MDKRIKEIMTKINKRYGEGKVTLAGQAARLNIKRIPTGSFTLDVETGGGYPLARVSIIAGPYSSGKTFMALKAVSEAQKMFADKNPVWIDAEGVFSEEWAKRLGVITDPEAPNALILVRPSTSEEALDIASVFVMEESVSIIVYDSLAATSPKDEIEGSMEDWTMGLGARLNNKFFRKIQGLLNTGSLNEDIHRPAILMINQTRKTMDKYRPETMPGGEGQFFFSSLIIWFRTGDRIEAKLEGSPEPVPVGQQIKFKTEKNKTFPPKRTGTFDIYFDDTDIFKAGDIDRLKEVTEYAIKYGVVEQAGAWFFLNRGTEHEKKFQGKPALITFLRENPRMMEKIEKTVMDIAFQRVDPETGEVLI